MKIFYLFIALAITGCTTAAKLNEINIGMSKQQVMQILGAPSSTSATKGVEYMRYNFYRNTAGFAGRSHKNYFVKIINGVVESYGQIGDFDSTKTPETKSTIDLNINK